MQVYNLHLGVGVNGESQIGVTLSAVTKKAKQEHKTNKTLSDTILCWYVESEEK